jgi:thiol-disulfide isomerase/thioredoxin
LLSELSLSSTSGVEQALIKELSPQDIEAHAADAAARGNERDPMLINAAFFPKVDLPRQGNIAPLDGAVEWLNSPPLTAEALRGKVVLVDFWTYSCINCIRTLPYVRAWADKYKDAGLVVIGVHTPEFAFEKKSANVRKALKDLDIRYPIAVDSNYSIWRAFRNQYWPAMYFVDAQGKVRHHVFGEGEYEESERVIQALLKESGGPMPAGDLVSVHGTGAQAEPGVGAMSGETYVGYAQASNFVSAQRIATDRPQVYEPASSLKPNRWTLGGEWDVRSEFAVATRANARIAYRFSARDLHLVMGRTDDGQPVRFRVSVDGRPPLEGHGSDVDAQGNGVIDAYRLYQLVRLPSAGEHLFEIEFLDAGAQPYVFTFG